MDVEAILRDKIKPELNKLYTSAPDLSSRGGDWGWSCREHAFHCYFLCRMLNLNAIIKRGDFTARKPPRPGDHYCGISSYEGSDDHAWCQVGDVIPVDLSVNFEYFSGAFPWIELVFGPVSRHEYTVTYTPEEEEFRQDTKMRASHARLSYLERHTVSISDDQLLVNPYAFLIRPPRDGIGDVFGNDIFNKITMHVYGLATRKCERMTKNRRGMRDVLPVLQERYPNATLEIRRILAENRNTSDRFDRS